MARSVYVLETSTITSGGQSAESHGVQGVFATLRKAQQAAEQRAWPLPPEQALIWKDQAKNSDDEAYQATITGKTTTRYSITRHHVH